MKSSPTLLQVTTSAWGGGLERLVLQVGEEAHRNGWRSLVAYHRGNAPASEIVEYIRMPTGAPIRTWPLRLIRLIKEETPSVVHLHDPGPGVLGGLACKAAGHRSVVYTDHFTHADRPWSRRVARQMTKGLPDMNIAVSTHGMNSLIEDLVIDRERVRLIRNGVPTADRVAPPDGSAPRFLYVANLWDRKGHLDLLEAVESVQRRIEIEVLLLGDGPERPAIEKRISSKTFHRSVRLMGYVEDPWALAEGAWAYLHPPLLESMPLAVLEAMVRGLPVVGTRTGGMPEIVSEGSEGFLVPPGDPDALADAMYRIATDRSLRDRMAEAARVKALTDFDESRCFAQYIDLYAELARAG